LAATQGTLLAIAPPEAAYPVRQAKSISTAEIDALLGPPMRPDPTLQPRSETNDVKPLARSPHKDPTNTQDTTRTMMELPPFAKGQPPSGVLGSIVYTARALRAGVDRALALRRLRADAVAKQQAREERLMELGELAVAVPQIVNAALDAARPHISTLDDMMQAAERERGAVVAGIANEERQAAEAARSSDEAAYAIQTRMAEIDGRIRPLAAAQKQQEKEIRDAEQTISGASKKIDALGDKKRQAEARGSEGAGDVADAAAKIAALRAEVEAAERALPVARESLERVTPELEQLRVSYEAVRTELETNQKGAAAREQQKKETLKKLDERRASIDRELQKAQADRGVALQDLGAKLDWDRIQHPDLAPRYRALDEIAGALTAIDYQIAELERAAGAVDRKAFAIAAVTVLAGGALFALIVWLLVR
jgi:chromosome segregation ATPase